MPSNKKMMARIWTTWMILIKRVKTWKEKSTTVLILMLKSKTRRMKKIWDRSKWIKKNKILTSSKWTKEFAAI